MTKQTTAGAGEFQNNGKNPEGQSAENKMYSTEEYKNLQAFGTKANQGLIDVSKKLAEKDPKELLGMEAQIQNKVVKDIWGYENLDELKVMLPDLFEEDNGSGGNSGDGFKQEDVLIQMQREQELLKMKLNKKDVDDELEKFSSLHSTVVASIPNFEQKVREELMNISSSLPTKERVKRATKFISGNSDIEVEAYLQLQGKNFIKSSNSGAMTDEHINIAQNKMRKQFGLAQK